jgi:KDO2-lipid IV(A) lauroyltransferase
MISVSKNIGTPAMTELLMKSRRAIGQEIVPADGAFRPLYEGLKEGADVGLLVDQVVKPENGGVWVEFFGRPMPVSVAPAFLAAKTRSAIIVAWSRPLKDGTYRCEFISLYPWQKGTDIWRRTQDCIRDLERVIRRHPSCWVLNYRYFRKKPKEADLKQLAERKAKYKLAETNA